MLKPFTLKNLTKRQAALIIGISLLIMTVAAGISYGAIHSTLFDPDSEAVSRQNVADHPVRFGVELGGWVIVIITDALICLGVWIYFRNESKPLALAGSVLRLIYTVILTLAVIKLFQVFANGATGGKDGILPLVDDFERIWSFGLIIFGIHLITLGLAALPETRIWGILLMIAGTSYVLVHSMDSFLPRLSDLKTLLNSILAVPMTIGELGFGIWLLFRGGKVRKAAS